jgi:hypothetical protein
LAELVRNFVAATLLPSWLRDMKGDYMDLLHALDVENSTETSILALNTLFKLVEKQMFPSALTLSKVPNTVILQEGVVETLAGIPTILSEGFLYSRSLLSAVQPFGSIQSETAL